MPTKQPKSERSEHRSPPPTRAKAATSADVDHAPPHPTTRQNAGIRVLCVDDHEVLVEGLKAQFGITGSIHVVGWLPSAERLLEETSCLNPDVVLLDIEMPGPDAFEVADRLRHMFPRVRLVFLSAHVRDGYIAAAYKCGANGYFAKGDDLHAIAEGVREVAQHSQTGEHHFVMGPKVRERCLTPRPITRNIHTPTNRDGPPSTPLESLSEREIEVLRLIGKGLSRNEIAQELSRSAKTIDGHQERILKKLGIESRTELMRFAIREGLSEA